MRDNVFICHCLWKTYFPFWSLSGNASLGGVACTDGATSLAISKYLFTDPLWRHNHRPQAKDIYSVSQLSTFYLLALTVLYQRFKRLRGGSPKIACFLAKSFILSSGLVTGEMTNLELRNLMTEIEWKFEEREASLMSIVCLNCDFRFRALGGRGLRHIQPFFFFFKNSKLTIYAMGNTGFIAWCY